jgi:hypothetical protein
MLLSYDSDMVNMLISYTKLYTLKVIINYFFNKSSYFLINNYLLQLWTNYSIIVHKPG